MERQATRERLLEAARELFGVQGFDGVGVRAIADKAGCNLSLINHYFGSKEGLLQAVVLEGMDAVAEELRRIVSGSEPAEERLRRFIDFTIDYIAKNHRIFVIAHREMECIGSMDASFMPRIAVVHHLLIGLVTELADKGKLLGVDPQIAAMLLVAMIRFYFTSRPISEKVLGPPTPELLSALKRHVATIFLHGVLGAGAQ